MLGIFKLSSSPRNKCRGYYGTLWETNLSVFLWGASDTGRGQPTPHAVVLPSTPQLLLAYLVRRRGWELECAVDCSVCSVLFVGHPSRGQASPPWELLLKKARTPLRYASFARGCLSVSKFNALPECKTDEMRTPATNEGFSIDPRSPAQTSDTWMEG